jgi:hypothetical protein
VFRDGPFLATRYGITGIKNGLSWSLVRVGALRTEIGFQRRRCDSGGQQEEDRFVEDFDKVMKRANVEKGILFHVHRKGAVST